MNIRNKFKHSMNPREDQEYLPHHKSKQFNNSNCSSDLSVANVRTVDECRAALKTECDSSPQKASFLYRFEHNGVVVYDSDARILGYHYDKTNIQF